MATKANKTRKPKPQTEAQRRKLDRVARVVERALVAYDGQNTLPAKARFVAKRLLDNGGLTR